MTNNKEFQGATKQAFIYINETLKDFHGDIKNLNNKYWIVIVLLAALTIEKFPSFAGTVLAYIK